MEAVVMVVAVLLAVVLVHLVVVLAVAKVVKAFGLVAFLLRVLLVGKLINL